MNIIVEEISRTSGDFPWHTEWSVTIDEQKSIAPTLAAAMLDALSKVKIFREKFSLADAEQWIKTRRGYKP